MKKILIGMPTARYIEPETFKSIWDQSVPDGYVVDFVPFYSDQIDDVRNDIAQYVIDHDYDYLFSVDSDIVVPPNTLSRFLEQDRDMITGVYIQRIPNTHVVEVYGATPGGGRQQIPWDLLKGRGTVEVAGCGFGCVLIKRSVLEGVESPRFEYHSALDHRNTVSEDVIFCVKATNAGFTIWADTRVLCDHLGNHTYRVEDN